MSSPAAGIEMLRNRSAKLADSATLEALENPVKDQTDDFESDSTPSELIEATDWSEYQMDQLRSFEKDLTKLSGPAHDNKLVAAHMVAEDWIDDGLHPVIFCRYIATANYLGEQLKKLFSKSKKHKQTLIEVVTSENPDELRRSRINAMKSSQKRILIATDCLSEGINLHELFTAVLHYDLPWNPNRLEQREGRVDRFGQTADEVKAYLLFSKDNPVDGIVLDVILRKVREIKRATGINIPFPEDSQSIIDTITKSLLVNDDRRIQARKNNGQIEFSFDEFDEAKEIDLEVTDAFQRNIEREKTSRSIFAQHRIKAAEFDHDLKDTDAAIGDPATVESFVTDSLRSLFGVQVDARPENTYRIYTANLPSSAKALLPEADTVDVTFRSPAPRHLLYLGRNHLFVEQLTQIVLAHSLDRERNAAARASVLRTSSVDKPTHLFLFRVRNVIESKDTGKSQIVAEETLLWGYRGSPDDADYLDQEEAYALLNEASPSADLAAERQARTLKESLVCLPKLDTELQDLAHARCQNLVEAHERFSAQINKGKFQVVIPVLPMDLLGLYVLLPAQ